MKKPSLDIPRRPRVPFVSCVCNVLKSAATGRFAGQIMDAGATKMRLQMPAIEKPISWVDMTNSHWSVFGEETNQYVEMDLICRSNVHTKLEC